MKTDHHFVKLASGLLAALILTAGSRFGQFGGLLKKINPTTGNDNVPATLAQGNNLIGYITLATDQGMRAIQELASVFPPEKVAKLQEIAAKYNEAKSARKDG